jgi:2-oxoglutarate ferredoxin oxidoreductase subunit alpha
MGIDITVKIGGEAGQGIQTVGNLLALVCQKAGLYTMTTNEFESRIRGGNSFFQIRISDHPVAAPVHNVHLLMALNQETYDLYGKEVVPDGLVVMGNIKKGVGENICGVPLGDLAKKAGGGIFTNTVAAGACLSLLGAPFDLFKTILKNRFKQKGPDIIDQNIHAGELGYQAVKDVPFNCLRCPRR